MLEPLLPLDPLISSDDDQNDVANILLQVHPRFFVPRLREQPQDPIIDSLKLSQDNLVNLSTLSDGVLRLPPELTALAESWISEKDRSPEMLWTSAFGSDREMTSKIRSWDALRSTFDQRSSSGPFLSEQSTHIFASARYHVDPHLHNPNTEIVHADTREVLESVKTIILGTSSLLYTWEPASETFNLARIPPGKIGKLVLDGRDDVITQSFMQRFINIGTLLRRLEVLCDKLHERSSRAGPIMNAYMYSISSCVDHIRESLAELAATGDTGMEQSHALSAIWMQHAEIETVLQGLASLCHRDSSTQPEQYPSLSQVAEDALSDIYSHLSSHIERDSPRVLIAMLSYILTTTSNHYLLSLGESVGYSRKTSSAPPRVRQSQLSGAPEGFLEDDLEMGEPDRNDDTAKFPAFISSDAETKLTMARKSLVLLKAAQPDHPILIHNDLYVRPLRWFWTAKDVQSAWTGVAMLTSPEPHDSVSHSADDGLEPDQQPSDLMAQFAIFSLEPGAHLSSAEHEQERNDAVQEPSDLDNFLRTFPSPPHLPSLTPTLPHLATLVLSPLLDHCTSLSRALLSLFLDPSSHLNLYSHLTLLRSFILLTSPAFKSRLKAALFSDSDDWRFEGSEARAMAKDAVAKRRERKRSRSRTKSGATSRASSVHSRHADVEKTEESEGAVWAVGLGLGLRERDSWPPGGADLSFYLRTVIVDSLESHMPRQDSDDDDDDDDEGVAQSTTSMQKQIWAEAEARLGFAIRDLPVGTGRERWLDPCSIESLDFLYVDYKPPHPLDVIITKDVLSKYQRMFSFILRLLRVQSALNALLRMTRDTSDPLFPTLSESNKLLLHLRFISHSFLDALCSYVFDTAVRANFDSFLARLQAVPLASTTAKPADSSGPSPMGGFTDLFSLGDTHSSILDSILSACLLRSSQRAAGDLLRSCLESILDLCILAGEIKRRRIKEYKASMELQELGKSIREKIKTFVMVLKTLVDKGTSKSNLPLEFLHFQQQHMQVSSGTGPQSTPHMAMNGTASLYHLLVRLDTTGWWRQAANARD